MTPPVQAGEVLTTELVSEGPRPRRLGGWLIVALVLLFAWPLQFIAAAIRAWIAVREHGLGPIWDQDPTWLLSTAWRLGAAGALTALSLFTLRPFWKKRRVARTLMLAFFAATFVVGIVNYVIAAIFAAPGAPPPNMLGVVLSTIIVALWIKYFASSDRVRETFVLP